MYEEDLEALHGQNYSNYDNHYGDNSDQSDHIHVFLKIIGLKNYPSFEDFQDRVYRFEKVYLL